MMRKKGQLPVHGLPTPLVALTLKISPLGFERPFESGPRPGVRRGRDAVGSCRSPDGRFQGTLRTGLSTAYPLPRSLHPLLKLQAEERQPACIRAAPA